LLKIKIEFIQVINHQLNTPLSIINLSIQALKDKTLPIEKVVRNIEATLNRINSTLDDFWLAYSVVGKKAKLVKTNITLYKLLESIVKEKT